MAVPPVGVWRYAGAVVLSRHIRLRGCCLVLPAFMSRGSLAALIAIMWLTVEINCDEINILRGIWTKSL